MKYYLILFTGVLLLLNSCSKDSPTDSPAITFDALFTGNVVNQDDNAVTKANILIAFYTNSCGSSGNTVAARTDVSDQGEFRRTIQHPTSITIRCLEFLVSSPDDSFESKLVREVVDMELKSEEPLPTKEVTIWVQLN